MTTFLNTQQTKQTFFSKKRKKEDTHYYIIYKEGRKRRRKSIVKGNTAEFQAQKAGAKICFQEHREKRG